MVRVRIGCEWLRLGEWLRSSETRLLDGSPTWLVKSLGIMTKVVWGDHKQQNGGGKRVVAESSSTSLHSFGVFREGRCWRQEVWGKVEQFVQLGRREGWRSD